MFRVLFSIIGITFSLLSFSLAIAAEPSTTPDEVLAGLKAFYAKTARADGSFQPGIDPEYQGMSDSAYSDLAAVTYACTISKTFGWTLPHEQKTIEFLLGRQKANGDFFNLAGTVDPASPQGRVYNTTQALVALHALGAKPKFDPLPVFEEILKQDYKTLPAYSTSFFPLAYLCAGKPIPPQADKAIRALMIQDEDGYLNDHIAATFHASHYYALVGDPTPKPTQMLARILRDQKPDGSWSLNLPARDRHATFDAVFTLKHEGAAREDCKRAMEKAAQWALSCRNADGGFGHYPGSTSDADAIYFQVGALVMAGYLKPVDPLPKNPHLYSWGHLMPVRPRPDPQQQRMLAHPGWVASVALSADGQHLATGCGDGNVRLYDGRTGKLLTTGKGHTDVVAAVALSPGGKQLVSGSYDGTVKIWDAASGSTQRTWKEHRGAVLCVQFAPRGDAVAAGGIDGRIVVWDVASGEKRRELVGHKSWINSLALSAGGERIVSGSSDGTVKIWSAASGELQKTLPASKAEVRSVAISPDGKQIAAGIRYGAVKVWNTESWEEIADWQSPADDVGAVAFTPDGKQLLVGLGEWNRPGRVEVWDIAGSKKARELAHTGEVLSVSLTSDGKTLAIGGGDNAAAIWTGLEK
jgi:geranylgeranyl transferase type-2 subunit beta